MENHQLMGKLMCVMRMHRKAVDRMLDFTGLHQAQHRLLMCLAKNRFKSQVEVAQKMEVTPATIAVSLKKLERDGFIRRNTKKEDNRFNNIEITKKGYDIIERSEEAFKSIEREIFRDVTEMEKEQLSMILDKLYHNMKEQYDNGGQKGRTE